MAENARAIIDGKGGSAAVAAAIRKQPGAVRAWKHRNHIPRSAWPDLIDAFPDITLERLRAVEGHQLVAAA